MKWLTNFSFRKLFANKKVAVSFSVVLAFIFWLIIVLDQNPDMSRSFSDVPIAINTASLEKMGEKSAKNLINAIEKSKENDLCKLIFAFGIRHIGQKAAKIIADKFSDIEEIFCAKSEDFEAIDGIGSVLAESIYEFFSLESTRVMVDKFKEYGLNTTEPNSVIDNRFEGMTFVLTGTLPTYTRQEAAAIIESMGGKTSSSVSKKTSIVLAGEEAGSKLDKANALVVRVIDEAEFLEMIK